jgi:hypothetical protein
MPAGDLKGRQRDAEEAEDELPAHGKAGQHDEAGQRALARHPLAPRRVGALSVMARNEGIAAKGSTRKKIELSASTEKRTSGAWLNSFNAISAGLVQIMP